MELFAINGPTSQGLPAFDWSKTNFTNSRVGEPNLFNFTFEKFVSDNTEI